MLINNIKKESLTDSFLLIDNTRSYFLRQIAKACAGRSV